jgi:putative DNA primase/helicase
LTIDKPDPLLPAKLSQEGSGILNRMLDGLRDYLENGLIIPDEVSEATANYRDDSDPLGRFLNHCVERKPGQRVQSSAMHRLYCAWARGAGEREWTAKGLTMALKERGFIAKQSNVMWWLDCQLLVSEIDFADAPAPPHAGADE